MFNKVVCFCMVLLPFSSIALAQVENKTDDKTSPRTGSIAINKPIWLVISYSMLLGQEKVQKEIDLKPEQEDRIKILYRILNDKMESATKSQDTDTRNKNNIALENQVDEIQAKLKIILSPSQFERLKQIRYQYKGAYSIIEDPELYEELGITDGQQNKITALKEEITGKIRLAMKDSEKKQQLQREMNDRLLDILTKEQRNKFIKMCGKPFNPNN